VNTTQKSYPGSPVPVVASRSPAARLTGLVAALLDPQGPCPMLEAEEEAPPVKQHQVRLAGVNFINILRV